MHNGLAVFSRGGRSHTPHRVHTYTHTEREREGEREREKETGRVQTIEDQTKMTKREPH